MLIASCITDCGSSYATICQQGIVIIHLRVDGGLQLCDAVKIVAAPAVSACRAHGISSVTASTCRRNAGVAMVGARLITDDELRYSRTAARASSALMKAAGMMRAFGIYSLWRRYGSKYASAVPMGDALIAILKSKCGIIMPNAISRQRIAARGADISSSMAMACRLHDGIMLAYCRVMHVSFV